MKNEALTALYKACFDSSPEITDEGQFLIRFLIERQFIKSVDEESFLKELAFQLQPTDLNRKILNGLDLSRTSFEDSEIEEIVILLLEKFEEDPQQNRFVPRVLKQASKVDGVQKRMAMMFKKICHIDDATADAILDIIWDPKIRSTLEGDLRECVRLTTNEHWKSNALGALKVIEWERQAGKV